MELTKSVRVRKVKKFSMEKRKVRAGMLFVSPWILGLLIFYAYPLLASVYYSFTSYSVINPGEFVGLDNYRRLLRDDLFWISIRNTLHFTVMSVPINLIFAICIALSLNRKILFQGIYRTIFFIPTLVPIVATATVWRWLMNTHFGLINSMLAAVNISPVPWLASPQWTRPSMAIISAWGVGTAVVVNLAGLQGVSTEYYEAAEVDGANAFQKIFHITLPLLTPVIFYNLVMGMIGALQVFTLPFTLTFGDGSPVNSLTFYVMHIYNNAFGFMRMGYASAMAWILFLIILVLTVIVFRTSKRWVHYS